MCNPRSWKRDQRSRTPKVVLLEEGTIINGGDPGEVINYYLNRTDTDETVTETTSERTVITVN